MSTMDLWETADGVRCTLTTAPAGPPFLVAIWQHTLLIKTVCFDSHEAAIECAIDALQKALPKQQ